MGEDETGNRLEGKMGAITFVDTMSCLFPSTWEARPAGRRSVVWVQNGLLARRQQLPSPPHPLDLITRTFVC